MVRWDTPTDAMPWVGLYVAAASLVCTLAMAADVIQGFRKWKLWFPNRLFTLNTASITLIAIAMKLPVDLNIDLKKGEGDFYAKVCSIYFLVTMLANFLPSLGLMDDRELLLNMVAWGILIVTITVNIGFQIIGGVFRKSVIFILIFPLLWVFSVALTVPASRRILEHRYKELHESDFNQQEINFSYKELRSNVIKYWMMAETGNPQFALACSQVSSAFGVICLVLTFIASVLLVAVKEFNLYLSSYEKDSDYKWSLKVIIGVQLVGVVIGGIAPIFRCLTSISYFSLSKKWTMNQLNVFRVEKHWTQMLHDWKRSHVSSHIPGRLCKIVFRFLRNMLLNLCIALQVIVVVMCKVICLVPTFLLIVLSSCWYIFKSLVKRLKKKSNVSYVNMRSEMEEYMNYVIQVEDEAKLSERVLRNSLNSITRHLHVSEKKWPRNLMKLLQKSTGFNGVIEFDSEQVPALISEETQNSWSLVTVTLTAIAVALPKIVKGHVKGLLDGVKEGLQIVSHVEEILNTTDELVKAGRASRCVGEDVEVYRKWLEIDLQKKGREKKTSKEILQWLGDKSVKTVIEFKTLKNVGLDHSFHKFIAANSMYRISQTIMRHYDAQENWPTDEEVFEQVSTIIADILFACFTNLPRVITMKCHHDAIEKRQGSIRTAAQILGKSEKILKILESRQLPNLDMDSMAYLDKWHALPKSQIANSCASSSSNESLVVTIM